MATPANCDIRGWTVQSSTPLRDGNFPASSRALGVPFGANRTSGVAPLGVVFVGGFSESSGTNRDFHNHHYSWDFDEVTSDTWIGSGKSRDTDTGPVTGHVFKTAGTYTVTCTVRNSITGATLRTETETITVTDPDTVFSGTNTIVVNNVGDTDFTGKPTGATEVNSDDFDSVLSTYLASGKRILFKVGGTWTCDTQTNTSGVTNALISYYGTGTSPDAQGLFSNAPLVNVGNVSAINLDNSNDLKIVGLRWSASEALNPRVIAGNRNIRHMLVMDNQSTGFDSPFGTSNSRASDSDVNRGHYYINNKAEQFYQYAYFAQAEELLVMGNRGAESSTTHVCRVLASYKGAISHNDLSGSSVDNINGRHAIKLHGPKQSEIGTYTEIGSAGWENPTKYTVVANNLLGNSAPWPLSVGPQDAGSDERLYDILIEKNRYHMEYGVASSRVVSIPFRVAADYTTIRNNVIDGAGGENDFRGMSVLQNGAEPAHVGMEIYNNTIFNDDTMVNGARGIDIGSGMTNTVVKNNLISYPNASTFVGTVIDAGTSTTESNNSRIDDPLYTDPTNLTATSRDFTLGLGSTAIDAGTSVPVYDDFNDTTRTGTSELGAFNY